MPSINELKKSNFLRKEDVGEGQLYTIKAVVSENVAKEGAPSDERWCLEFNEVDKPLVLNQTNGQIIANMVGSQEMTDWVGHKVVLYTDNTITFQGKLVGGIRVRPPKGQVKNDLPF